MKIGDFRKEVLDTIRRNSDYSELLTSKEVSFLIHRSLGMI
jgi:hypothetical protein